MDRDNEREKIFFIHADSRALIYIKNNHTHSNNGVLIL